jgi:pimeloyl-ACP methyl ester carboxylesterase
MHRSRLAAARALHVLLWLPLVSSALASCAGPAPADSTAPAGDAAPPSALTEKKTLELPTGVTLAYLEAGSPSGTPVVFLHGITDSSRTFRGTLTRLESLRPELRLLALDLRGHGDSSMPDPERCRKAPEACFGVLDLAADTLAFLNALGLPRAHLVGHSLGSLVAQEIALRNPERVLRAVLVATSGSIVDHPAMRDFLLGGLVEGTWKEALEARGLRFPEDAYELSGLDADPHAESWMLDNWVTEPAADPRLLAEIARETARLRIGTWLGAGRAVLAFESRERLRGLTVPTLVLWPVQDSMFPLETQRDLTDALHVAARDCGLVFFWKQYGRRPLPASGVSDSDLAHNLPWSAHEMIAADLAAFLRDGGAPTRDLPYSDPADPRRLRVDPGAAPLVVGEPGGSAAAPSCRGPAPRPAPRAPR